MKLLTRLYDPIAGRILLDGVDLREYDLEDLYSQIGVIFQDFMRYDMTATENIAMGKIDELHNAAMIAAVAGKSRADADIRRLPNGYRQVLGRRFDGGVDLSAANGRNWRWRALICGRPSFSFWMNPPPRWMPAPSARCSNASPN